MAEEVSTRSDAALVVAIARRSPQALDEVHRRHGGAVRALSLRVTRDDQVADEVCQTVFLRLWTTPERFDPGRGTLRSWLLAQAHGRAVDAVRSEAARRRREDRSAQLAVSTAPDVEAAAHASTLAEHVRRAVDQLPPLERAAILLAYFGGHSYRETANLLGEPEGTVKSRIRVALGHLRHALEAEGVRP